MIYEALIVAGVGPEPTTSGLWIRRSNQLSYPAIHALYFFKAVQRYRKKMILTNVIRLFYHDYKVFVR